MKVKIFKKVIAVFCAAIMTASVFELSVSAHGNSATTVFNSSNNQFNKLTCLFDNILSKLFYIGKFYNYNLNNPIEIKRQEASLNLTTIQGIIANQHNQVEEKIYLNLTSKVIELQNIINHCNDKNAPLCVNLLHYRVFTLVNYISLLTAEGILQA